jgi:hypothetical protein
MRAVMHEQIPGIGNQRTRNESAGCDQIDQRETNPYLPKDCEDRVVGIGVMQPMFGRCETMQHKAMHDIFRKGQRNDTTGEKTASELILSCEIASRTIARKDATSISPK